MSVLIRGMSGYECCADCEFCGGLIMPDGIYTCDCPPTRGMNITRAIEEDCKSPDCPLVELPEKHGDLIDRDALIKDLTNGIKAGLLLDGYEEYSNINNMEDCVECVKYADAVIKAEGE